MNLREFVKLYMENRLDEDLTKGSTLGSIFGITSSPQSNIRKKNKIFPEDEFQDDEEVSDDEGVSDDEDVSNDEEPAPPVDAEKEEDDVDPLVADLNEEQKSELAFFRNYLYQKKIHGDPTEKGGYADELSERNYDYYDRWYDAFYNPGDIKETSETFIKYVLKAKPIPKGSKIPKNERSEFSDFSDEKEETSNKVETIPTVATPVSQSPGETISIIGKRGRTHGSANGQLNVIPGIINSVNVHEIMLASGEFILGTPRPDTAWGNPVLADVMIAAAKFAQTFKNPESKKTGVIDLGNVSYKYGGPIQVSTSHQVGLDIDCSFYRNDGTSRWFKANENFDVFDVDRNVAFMYYLVTAANPKIVQTFVSNETWELLTEAVEESREEVKKMFKKLQSMRKSYGGVTHVKGHNDHYHVRIQHPKNSKTLEQLKKELGQEEFDILVKQSLSNSLVNIGATKKLDIVRKDEKYSEYYTPDIEEFLSDRPGVTNLAKKYNVSLASWKNTTKDFVSILKVRLEDINTLSKSKVINLQNALGIDPDGVVGGDTLTALSLISGLESPNLLEDKGTKLEKIDIEGFKKSPIYKSKKAGILKLVKAKLNPGERKTTSTNSSDEGSIIDLLRQTASSRFGFVVGTIDGTILASHNEGKMFYGASSNKTMAGLVQLIKFERDKESQLDDQELRGLLAYQSRIQKGAPDSNRVNRSLTGIRKFSYKDKEGKTKTKHPHYRDDGRPKIGVINGDDVKKVAKIFGINNGMFRWGGVRNKQAPLDQFKLFAGLARIDTENFKDQKEKQYYNEHKESFDRIIKITKERTTTQYKGGKGWLQNTGIYRSGTEGVWMKGGQAAGACNIAFVFEGKYVVSVYSNSINKGITEESPGPFSGDDKHFDKQGFLRDLDIVSKIVEELMKKNVLKTSSLEEITKERIITIIKGMMK
tara:strand:+ start:3452 stop:6244 length:2793 start_codon:yes stop_codon:yes gene_type:complete